MSQITLIRNAVTAQLVDANKTVKALVQKALSYDVNGGYGEEWTGITSMFDWETSKFPAGFTQSVIQVLKRKGYKVKLHRRPFPTPLGKPNPVVSDFPPNPAYDYQDETVERMVEKGGIIAQLSTGGGKSLVACKARARIGRMTLFITTQGTLMHQMRDNFHKAFKIEKRNGTLRQDATCGIIGDGEFELSRTCMVATVQSIAAIISQPKPEWDAAKIRQHLKKRRLTLQILEQTALLILEEAHETSGSQFYEVTRLCKAADYRLALTATPFMKADVEANMRLLGAVGGIGIKVTERYLIDNGIMAKPYFKFVQVGYEPDVDNIDKDLKGKYPTNNMTMHTDYQRAYTLGVVYNAQRNRIIVGYARRFKEKGLTSLILIKRKRHGQLLQQQLTQVGVKCVFISGNDKQDKRKKALNDLGAGKIDAVVGSSVFNVGIDCPAVSAIFIAGGDKAEVQTRQKIGRGLRAKKVGVNQCFVIDFIDSNNKHLRKHSFERKAIIMETDGFKQGVLEHHQPFPY